jgi:hypothetical protein
MRLVALSSFVSLSHWITAADSPRGGPTPILASVLDLRLWGWTRLGAVFTQCSMPELVRDNAISGLSSFSALSASASILEGSGGCCAYGSGRCTGILVRTCFEYTPHVDNGTQCYHPGGPTPSMPFVHYSYTAPLALYRTRAFRHLTTCLRLLFLCPLSRAASTSYTRTQSMCFSLLNYSASRRCARTLSLP